MKALVGANLIDGTGGPVANDSTVLIDVDRIVAAGPRTAINLPPNTEKVDISRLTLLPGEDPLQPSEVAHPLGRSLMADR